MVRPMHFLLLLFLLRFSTPWTVSGAELTTRVECVLRGEVLLPCDIDPPDKQTKLKVVLWYRENSSDVIFSYDARKSRIEKGMSWSEESMFGKRAQFQTEPPYGLLLKDVRIGDEGKYRCRVDFNRSPTKNRLVFLSVIVPPKPPIIKDKNRTVQEIVGPYRENENLELVCESYGGNLAEHIFNRFSLFTSARPSAALTWFREGSVIESRFQVLEDSVSKSTLRVFNLKRDDLGAKFTCQASNNQETIPAFKSVVLDMNFEPSTAKILGRNLPLSEYKEYKFTCQSTGARPPAKIIWSKGENAFHSSSYTVSYLENITISTSTFSPNYLDNGKNLTCHAVSSTLSGKGVRDVWVLKVYYLPRISLVYVKPSNHLAILEGDIIILRCEIRANPPIMLVTWKRNNEPITEGSAYEWSGNMLTIKNASRWIDGRYSCEATNMQGTSQSDVAVLEVQHKPSCLTAQDSSYRLADGEEVEVSCLVRARPEVTSVRWVLQSASSNVSWAPGMADKRSTLTYRARAPEDYGQLLCWGTNAAGEQDEPCSYEILRKRAPESLQNCSLEGGDSPCSLHVLCSEGHDGGSSQHFVAEVIDQETMVVTRSFSSRHPEFHIHDIGANGSSYLVEVYPVNEVGRGDPVKISRDTNSSARIVSHGEWTEAMRARGKAKRPLFQLTPILASLGAIVVTLMVIAVVIVVLTSRAADARRRGCSKGKLLVPLTPSAEGAECCDPAERQRLRGSCLDVGRKDGELLDKRCPKKKNPIITRHY